MRDRLNDRRHSWNFTINFRGEDYNVSIGHYDDGRFGEVFVTRIFSRNSAKVGTILDDVCRDAAILASVAVQYGADLPALAAALTRDEDGTPRTIITAIIDYFIQNGTPYHDDPTGSFGIRRGRGQTPDAESLDPTDPPSPIGPTGGSLGGGEDSQPRDVSEIHSDQ